MENEKKVSEQKIIVEKDGTIKIEWVNTEFSDTVIELLPEDRKKQIKKFNEKMGIKDHKIFCGWWRLNDWKWKFKS